MRIAVIAAQGRSGKVFVHEALMAGHEVRAGIRGHDIFEPHLGLMTVQCDATDTGQVAELIKTSDAVVSLLGHVPGSKADVQTQAIKTVIDAMQARSMTRLISLTGTGVRIDGDTPDLIDKFANASIKLIDPQRISDGVGHVEIISKSGMDFTVIRVLKLTSSLVAKPFDLTSHGPAKPFTSRKEVALAILDCLENNRLVREYPVISKRR